MSARDAICARVETLPELPISATRIVQLLQRTDVDVADILEVAEMDLGLTANVLRMANSAAYGARAEIRSLRNAIVRLGTRKVLEIVLLAVVGSRLRPPVVGYDLPRGKMLEHALAVGIVARELSFAAAFGDGDQAFTAGLLHDIGKVVLGEYVQVDAAPILSLAFERGISFQHAERAVLGIDHTEVGGMLLQRWGLPEEIVAAARWHHDPDEYDGGARAIVDLVHIGDSLSLMAGLGLGRDGLNYLPSSPALQRLNLKTEQLEAVLSEAVARVMDLSDAMGPN